MKSFERKQKEGFAKLNNALVKAGFKKEEIRKGVFEYKRLILNEANDRKILQHITVVKGSTFNTKFVDEIYFDVKTGKKVFESSIKTEDVISKQVRILDFKDKQC